MDGINRQARRALLRELKIKSVDVSELKQLGREARPHPPRQLCKIVACLRKFGFVLPILIDRQKRVVHGWALVLAARHGFDRNTGYLHF